MIEAGDERYRMRPGDSLFVKQNVPHAWTNVGNSRMRFLATVTPAGKLEDFFINAAKYKALPGPNPDMWRPYDMEWVGLPLKIE